MHQYLGHPQIARHCFSSRLNLVWEKKLTHLHIVNFLSSSKSTLRLLPSFFSLHFSRHHDLLISVSTSQMTTFAKISSKDSDCSHLHILFLMTPTNLLYYPWALKVHLLSFCSFIYWTWSWMAIFWIVLCKMTTVMLLVILQTNTLEKSLWSCLNKRFKENVCCTEDSNWRCFHNKLNYRNEATFESNVARQSRRQI